MCPRGDKQQWLPPHMQGNYIWYGDKDLRKETFPENRNKAVIYIYRKTEENTSIHTSVLRLVLSSTSGMLSDSAERSKVTPHRYCWREALDIVKPCKTLLRLEGSWVAKTRKSPTSPKDIKCSHLIREFPAQMASPKIAKKSHTSTPILYGSCFFHRARLERSLHT